MANITLTATRAEVQEGHTWSGLGAALTDDSVSATCAAGPSERAKFHAFSGGLPQDIDITGILVTLKAKVDVASGGTSLACAFSFDGVNEFTSYTSTTALTTAFAIRTIGGSSNLLGYDKWKRPKIFGNTDFTLHIKRSGASGSVISLQYLEITIYYTLRTTIGGERSDFPIDINSWPYPHATDTIPIVYNGTGPSHQVKSEQVNLLSDCLYQIESTVLSSTGLIRTISDSNTPLRITTITVTGNISGSPDLITYHNTHSRSATNGNTISIETDSNLTAVRRTESPFPPATTNNSTNPPNVGFWCPHVRGFGWIDIGGSNVPLCISPRGILCRRHTFPQGDMFFTTFGFQAFIPSNISVTYPTTTDSDGVEHFGATVDFGGGGTIPSGIVYVKLLGVSYEL